MSILGEPSRFQRPCCITFELCFKSSLHGLAGIEHRRSSALCFVQCLQTLDRYGYLISFTMLASNSAEANNIVC